MIFSPLYSNTQVFILRIWIEDMGDGLFEWRASIKNCVDGELRYFREWQGLADFLQAQLTSPPPAQTGTERC